MKQNNLLGFLIYFILILCSSLACNVPPSKWCSTRSIARHCQVEYQCESYLKTIQSPSFLSQDLGKNDVENDVHYFKEDVVKLGFYYETLCPDCKNFMTQQLYPAYKAIPDLFTVDFVPYGNAREYWDENEWYFRCQHGEEECYGNIISTCALNSYPYNTTFQFIACVEQSYLPFSQAGKICADKFGLNWKHLNSCSVSKEGNHLQHIMATKTESLEPTHQFVPWITLNGNHTDSIQKAAETNLIKLICDHFKGVKPKVCKKETLQKRLCPNNL